jgi:hypothetical protein
MSYEAIIALFGGDETTLTKSFIISLKNATTNWYARLPLEEDFFSYQQYERETLPYFFRRLLQLKAQAPEVSDEQAITQAIKALCAGQLHNHIVSECSRTLEELYDEFCKFSRAEVLHFHKLG